MSWAKSASPATDKAMRLVHGQSASRASMILPLPKVSLLSRWNSIWLSPQDCQTTKRSSRLGVVGRYEHEMLRTATVTAPVWRDDRDQVFAGDEVVRD